MRRSLAVAALGAALSFSPVVSHAQHAMHAAAGSTLRANLRTLLQEHAFLAANATGAAVGGRKTEVEASKRRNEADNGKTKTCGRHFELEWTVV